MRSWKILGSAIIGAAVVISAPAFAEDRYISQCVDGHGVLCAPTTYDNANNIGKSHELATKGHRWNMIRMLGSNLSVRVNKNSLTHEDISREAAESLLHSHVKPAGNTASTQTFSVICHAKGPCSFFLNGVSKQEADSAAKSHMAANPGHDAMVLRD